MSVFLLISANMEVILRRISTLSDDRLDAVSTPFFGSATCLWCVDKRGVCVGVGWQLSKCWKKRPRGSAYVKRGRRHSRIQGPRSTVRPRPRCLASGRAKTLAGQFLQLAARQRIEAAASEFIDPALVSGRWSPIRKIGGS